MGKECLFIKFVMVFFRSTWRFADTQTAVMNWLTHKNTDRIEATSNGHICSELNSFIENRSTVKSRGTRVNRL
jgi:hypothetical protein